MKIPSLRHLFPAPSDDKKKEDSDKEEEDSDKKREGDSGADKVWWMDKLNVIESNALNNKCINENKYLHLV